MNKTALALAVVLGTGGCHWNKRAQEPENTEDSESSSDSKPSEPAKAAESSNASAEADPSQASAMGTTGVGRTAGRAEKAVIRDDTEKAESPCNGMVISDLVQSLSQASCELPANAPAAAHPISKDVLEVTVVPDSAKIPPGSTARIKVVFKNKGKVDLPLDFTVDPDPRFVFELYTPKGARVDRPAGAEPALPTHVAEGDAPETRTARVTIAPNGTATAVLPWLAVRYRWASKEKAKGALAGHGYPREPAGPLGRGKYFLRVVAPLTNVDEGVEHEITRPHANIEIAGTFVPEPAPEPPKKKVAPPPAASSATSDATVEAQFLKAAGAPTPPPAPAKKKTH